MTEATDQNSWNKFIVENSSPASFLQSWEWGEFQKSLGHRVYRLQIEGILQAQVVVRKLHLGKYYLEIPKGPIFTLSPSPLSSRERVAEGQERGIWELLTKKLKELGQKENAVLARVNPPYDLPDGLLASFHFQKPELLLHQREPEQTILVDLAKSEDELLLNMHEKSRYNIRLATRKGVVVRDATNDKEAFARFLEILDETSRRDRIALWPHERFWKFREVFLANPVSATAPHAKFLVGEYQGKILAGTVVMLFGDAGTYLYAGSTAEERTANAPSVVLWEAIRLAKREGKIWYDMWGIAPRGEPHHPWAGITMFKSRYVKLGVTGKEVYQPGTRDLVLNKKFYALFKLAKKFRRG